MGVLTMEKKENTKEENLEKTKKKILELMAKLSDEDLALMMEILQNWRILK
tara:strand:- start:6894 stop:7046 length:153 start_codon:yes stop_codon:yes gene_type:complete